MSYWDDLKKDPFGSILDPGDIGGRRSASEVLDAGKEAQAYLHQLSDTSWQRQMQGLQLALGSMNNYNGVLSNLYGVQTNQYDPRNMGGLLGPYQGAPSAAQPPPAAPAPPMVEPPYGADRNPRQGPLSDPVYDPYGGRNPRQGF